MSDIKKSGLEELYAKSSQLIESSRNVIGSVANAVIIYTNYEIGKYIIEEEQKGEDRAKYGARILDSLSRYLSGKYGRGFSRTNLAAMRKFYTVYKDRDNRIVRSAIAQLSDLQASGIVQSTIAQSDFNLENWPFPLSWTHYQVLMRIEDDNERAFYEAEAARSHWNVRNLKRQYHSSLYERIALSREKEDVLKLATKGSDLESAVLGKLQDFLLEMGKGFLFEKRQKRFVFDEKNFYLDLVLYNRFLHCYVLIDFKTDELTHQDLGQMQMYVNYYDRYEKTESENPTIGILLCKQSDKALVDLTLPENANIYAQEYKLYLPDKKLLQSKLQEWIAQEENKA